MGRQRNNPHMKEKGEVSETMLNEKEASQILFNIIIRYWVQSNGYQEAQWAHRELPKTTGKLQWTHWKLYQHEKKVETINKGQEEMKHKISELKNTVEGIKSRLDEAEDRINELEDKVEKNTHKEQEKEKRLGKNEEGLRAMQDLSLIHISEPTRRS